MLQSKVQMAARPSDRFCEICDCRVAITDHEAYRGTYKLSWSNMPVQYVLCVDCLHREGDQPVI